MKVTITITDTEEGHARVECTPDMPTLVKMHRDNVNSIAVGHAMIGLKAIIELTLKDAKEKMKKKMRAGSQLIMPDRFRLQ